MMIACSRPGYLPANLQGIWNNSNWPTWTADYHTDINIQMNNWFVEPANLPECALQNPWNSSIAALPSYRPWRMNWNRASRLIPAEPSHPLHGRNLDPDA